MNAPEPPGRLLKIFGAVVFAYLLAPLFIVMGMSLNAGNNLSFPPKELSLRWYQNMVDSPEWTDAISISVQLGLTVALVTTVLGYTLALGLTRSKIRGKALVTGLALSPLIIPSVVLGVAFYLVFADLKLVSTFEGLVIAHVVMALPYVVVNIMAGLQLVDRDLERAARSLGAGPFSVFRRITLPLTWPAIAAAAIFAFVTSWDEVVVAIFITGPDTQTLPIVMWSQLRTAIDPTIAAVATVLMFTTILALGLGALAMKYVNRRTAP